MDLPRYVESEIRYRFELSHIQKQRNAVRNHQPLVTGGGRGRCSTTFSVSIVKLEAQELEEKKIEI